MTTSAIICALGASVVASVAMACEPLPPHLVKDPKIRKSADCSFSEGQWGYHGPHTGGPAVRIGEGKFAQKLTSFYDGGLCGIELERLLVVDCDKVQDVLFEGRERDPEAHSETGTEIRSIQPPKGPIALKASSSLEQLKTAAKRARIDFAENTVRGLAASTKRRNRFDPYCGCKLHYPQSQGALQ